MRFAANDTAPAREAWERSVGLCPSAWAYRNLAALAGLDDQWPEAADLYAKALALVPALRPLVIECCRAMLRAERPETVRDIVAHLPESLARDGRILLLRAQAALAEGAFDTAEATLMGIESLPDIREGEVATTDLWFALHEQRIARAEDLAIDEALRERVRREFPPPTRLDFRMA
jgi:tetratricopeptide (TPR) repeat protein